MSHLTHNRSFRGRTRLCSWIHGKRRGPQEKNGWKDKRETLVKEMREKGEWMKREGFGSWTNPLDFNSEYVYACAWYWVVTVFKCVYYYYAVLLLWWGGTQRLPRLVGPSIAKELIFTGRVIDGIEAHSIGLVNHVVDQNDAGDAAFRQSLEIAQQIVANVSCATLLLLLMLKLFCYRAKVSLGFDVIPVLMRTSFVFFVSIFVT